MDVPPGFIVSIIREAAAESYRKILTFDKFHISVKNRRRSVDSRAACVVYCTENLYVKGVARMKKTYLGLMGLFLLPQTALAVDAAAPASTSVSSPLTALWRVLLTPITVPHLPWQLPLLAPVALVLVLLLLIFCLLARRGGYRRGFREGERVVMRQMAREEQEAAVPPMPHRPAPQQPAAPKPAPQPEKAPTPPPAEEKKPAPPAAEKPASPVRETPAPAAPVSQEEKPDELDIDLLLEEIKRM